MKRKVMAAVIGAALTLAGGLIGYTAAGQDSREAVAQVNGAPVTVEEFEQALSRQRASVIDYFHRTYGADYEKQFWQREYGGENPLSMVKKQALQELVRNKVELELAKRHGLLPSTSYTDLQKEMEKENERRAAALKARLPVYGPTRLDAETFMPYYISKLRIALKEKLTAEELGLTAEELLRIKEEEHNPALPAEERVRFRRFAAVYRSEAAKGSSAEMRRTAEERLSSLKQLLEQGKDAREALGQLPVSSQGREVIEIRITESELNRETAGTLFKTQPSLYAVLADGLKPGELSPVFDEALQGEWALVQVLDREETDRRTAVNQPNQPGQAEEKITWDTAYLRYLDRLAAEAKVTFNPSRYADIGMQQ